MEPKTLLDTDVLSGLMRKTPAALNRARSYLTDHEQLTISLVTRFEILRGLKAKRATAQLAAFDSFCTNNEVLPISDRTIVRAADIYADLHFRGQLISDADILIAATALENGLVMATNNLSDFGRIASLRIDNWLG
ncbi:MAG: type II toxin-antitoxin system VapC family toxin [Planctomycetes bacterium]|nr:type II toxin-antitoxin system VapC family toxin [Planctomycetota bacterium]